MTVTRTSITPTNGATGVAVDTPIVVEFARSGSGLNFAHLATDGLDMFGVVNDGVASAGWAVAYLETANGTLTATLTKTGNLPPATLILGQIMFCPTDADPRTGADYYLDYYGYSFTTAGEAVPDPEAVSAASGRTSASDPTGRRLRALTAELDMYRFIIFEIRRKDLQASPRPGTELLKRFFRGPNAIWARIVQNLLAIRDLSDIEHIEPSKLRFLKNIVGWTDEQRMRLITDDLDDATLRRLISVSGRLWKTRGPEDSIIDVLGLLTPARTRIWSWFDFRWVLGETELGEEHEGHDAWMVHLPAEVEQHKTIDSSPGSTVAFGIGIVPTSNRATGNKLSCTIPGILLSTVAVGQTFFLRSGAQNGYRATIAGFTGTGPTTITFVQDASNTLEGTVFYTYVNAEWEIVDLNFMPDDARRSNLRIVDDGNLDRTLIKRIIRLMRGSGERFDITYLSMLDLFDVADDDTQWEPPTGGNLLVENGQLRLVNTAAEESTSAIVTGATAWTQYFVGARIRGTSTDAAALFGLTFYRTDEDNYYAFLLNMVDQTVVLRKVVAGTPTTLATFELNSISSSLIPNVYYLMRAVIVAEGATNRIQLFIDNRLMISVTDADLAAGSVGFIHDIDASMEIDEVEVVELAQGSDTLELNERV